MTDKLDPFDVKALEGSLNDSATRVSAIWISFLVFGLYLVIAAGTVTHRQLFLEDPVKLPIGCLPYVRVDTGIAAWSHGSGLQRGCRI